MMVLLPAVVHADDVVEHDIHTKFQLRFRHFMKYIRKIPDLQYGAYSDMDACGSGAGAFEGELPTCADTHNIG